MRWLFIAVLVILVGLILSIAFMNDNQDFPQTDTPAPAQQNQLAPPPGNP
ncbi:hypothetical protein KX729_06820 [Rhizobium sp. XQZ8]|nr:hypothetical protein [Rhizobium populisoli]MBW6421150.1 hypothetical protein [Rhizobium populisoli]